MARPSSPPYSSRAPPSASCLQRPRQIGHDDPLAGRDAAVLPVDRPPVRRVAKDQIENRVQVGLRRRELDAVPGERDRRLDQPAPGKRRVPLVRGFQPRDRAGHGARTGADEEDLRRRAVEVDVDRLHVRLGKLGGAPSRQSDEEVEQAVGSVPCPVHEQEAARRRGRSAGSRPPTRRRRRPNRRRPRFRLPQGSRHRPRR